MSSGVLPPINLLGIVFFVDIPKIDAIFPLMFFATATTLSLLLIAAARASMVARVRGVKR